MYCDANQLYDNSKNVGMAVSHDTTNLQQTTFEYIVAKGRIAHNVFNSSENLSFLISRYIFNIFA